jgi:acyl-CoA synthetase (AMP-forming)/AMP-acid ligase II
LIGGQVRAQGASSSELADNSVLDGVMQGYPLILNKFLEHAAKWHPNAEIVTADGENNVRRISYKEAEDRCRRLSAALRQKGVRAGERIATLAWNSVNHFEALYAIIGIGAVCHTLNPRLTAEQLADMLRQSGATILFASSDVLPLAARVAQLAPALVEIISLERGDQCDQEGIATSLDALVATSPTAAQWGDFDENAPSGLCFTSGTTGAPKGVTYTHRSNFLHTLRMLQAEQMALTRHDRVLVAVPMFHANAWGLPFTVPAVGARLVLPGRKNDGASLARLIVDECVTVGVGVPTIWLDLADHLGATGQQIPSLERVIVGGSALPAALMARIERALGCKVQTSWGMTELSPSGSLASMADPGRSAELSGRPALGVDLLLKDADGKTLADQRGTEGHLFIRGSSVIERYFGHAEPATDAEGWFATGDLARIDRDGNLIITGRAKDLIKSGGEWINPAEIEAIIGALPEVSLAAVIAERSDRWGERPLLVVALTEGIVISDEQLLSALRDKVASWWLPDTIVRVGAMPLAATGKIDKMRLRSEYGCG